MGSGKGKGGIFRDSAASEVPPLYASDKCLKRKVALRLPVSCCGQPSLGRDLRSGSRQNRTSTNRNLTSAFHLSPMVTCPGLYRGCTRLDVTLLVVLSPMGGVCKPKEVGFPLWLPHGLARVPSQLCNIGGPSATSQTPFITSPSPVLAGFVRLSLFIKDQSSTRLGCSSHLTGTRDPRVEMFRRSDLTKPSLEAGPVASDFRLFHPTSGS